MEGGGISFINTVAMCKGFYIATFKKLSTFRNLRLKNIAEVYFCLQRSFFSSASCLAVFSFIDDPLLLRRWDTSACTMALWWLMCITKFVLSVAAIVKACSLFFVLWIF